MSELLQNPMLFWLILAIVFLVMELLTLGLTTIWFTGGALAALICSWLGCSLTVSIIIFFVVSIILLMSLRPIAKKRFNNKRIKTNAESLIDEKGIVIETIDNLMAKGRVSIAGQEWSARSANDEVKIAKGMEVKVLSISGVKLIVEVVEEIK